MYTKLFIGMAAACAAFVLCGLFVLGFSRYALSQDGAADAVIAEYPALAAYRTTSLPPSSIEGERVQDGWRVAFIQRGSGVPGILNAQCFSVTNDKKVEATGTYIRSGDTATDTIDFETCAPAGSLANR